MDKAREDKRERILKAAEQLFAKQGYAHTTMEQIVDALGVTKPFVYHYFNSKLEIFETLSWKPTVACFSAMDFAPDDTRPAHIKVVEGLERLVRLALEHNPSTFFAYREPQVYRPEYMAAQKRVANAFYAKLCALLEEGRADGMLDFEDTKVTALAACSLTGFLFYWYRPDGRLPPEAMIKKLTEASCRVIGLRRRRRAQR
ncbi:MAG: TetR/AcrR family transcriptional regulator [Ottowia sp.]|uniref:TetR/AcrR family transcriptional regulator n=1 Tax=Ottowia sp. TaxID=1898956 RepID=UPI0039E4DDDB